MENQTISLLDTHPALLLTILPGFQVAKDWTEEGDPVEAVVNAHPEPLCLIVDLRQAKLTLEDLFAGASRGARGNDPIWHSPKILGVYFITENRAVELAVAGLKHAVFGGVKAKVLLTVEEALRDIEQAQARAL